MTFLIALLSLSTLASQTALEDYRRANILFQQKRFAEAAELLDRSLKTDPAAVSAWTLRGKIALAFNRLEIAREAFLKASTLDPSSEYVQFMLGFFYYVDNDFLKAVPPLEKALSLDPSDPRPCLYLAMSHEGLARPDLAAAFYEKAIALEAKAGKPNPDTFTAYGRLLFTLGKREESARQVEQVLKLDPESRDGHYEKGRIFFEQENFIAAISEGERALQRNGLGTTDRQIHFLLTRAYAKAGNQTLADVHRKLFQAAPSTLRR